MVIKNNYISCIGTNFVNINSVFTDRGTVCIGVSLWQYRSHSGILL